MKQAAQSQCTQVVLCQTRAATALAQLPEKQAAVHACMRKPASEQGFPLLPQFLQGLSHFLNWYHLSLLQTDYRVNLCYVFPK